MRAKQSNFSLILIGIVLAGLLILAAGILLFQGQTVNTQHIEQASQANEVKCADIQHELQNKAVEEQQLASVVDTLKLLETNLVDYQYMPTYLKQMQIIAKNTGNTINNISPDAIKPLDLTKGPLESVGTLGAQPASGTAGTADAKQAQYRVEPITLDVQGSYPSMVRLLDAFRRFPKLIFVRTVDITKPVLVKKQLVISARLKTYAIITPDQYLAVNKKPEVLR